MRKAYLVRRKFAKYKPPKQCRYCKTELKFETATVEHIVPQSLGGTFHFSNLDWACKECNNNKMSIGPGLLKDIYIRKFMRVKANVITEDIVSFLLKKVPNIYIFFKEDKYQIKLINMEKTHGLNI